MVGTCVYISLVYVFMYGPRLNRVTVSLGPKSIISIVYKISFRIIHGFSNKLGNLQLVSN